MSTVVSRRQLATPPLLLSLSAIAVQGCHPTPDFVSPTSAPLQQTAVRAPKQSATAPKGSSTPVPARWSVPVPVATGLTVPWALAFAPDGQIFVTERPGRIRVIQNGRLLPSPWRTLDVVNTGEMGLLGIALAPDFARTKHIFVVGTYRAAGGYVNRVVRLTDRQGRGVEPKIIVDGIPAGPRHSGDAIAFGPDGMLYIATGDARRPSIAQDRQSLGGKILRYRPDGSIPANNPFRGSPVYALGLRNPQGMVWDKQSKTLFATDHGPSGFRNEGAKRHHDELNVIRPGANYGWPIVAGQSNDRRFVPPLVDWTPAIAPSGLALKDGSLYIGALKGQQLRRIDLRRFPASKRGWRVTRQQALLKGNIGRVRAVQLAPDGSLYLTTSNLDDNSRKKYPGDDKVWRLTQQR